MAFYKRFKLPPLKVSTNVSGSVSTSVARRRSHWNEELSESRPTAIESTTCGNEQPESVDSDTIEPTLHELERQSAARGWEQLRRSLLLAAVESGTLPLDCKCVMCSGLGIIRCLDCGPGVHYCEKCFRNQHEKTNVFHIAEKWEVCWSYQ